MKVMAINSSMRRETESVTELLLTQLVTGMKEAGAEVNVVHLRQKRIRDCKGCYSCQSRTPGKCIIRDDMTTELLPEFRTCDMVVYGTPLFQHLMSARLKRFIERTFPICRTTFRRKSDGRWTNSLRDQYPLAVILAVGGYLDESAFQALSHYAHYLWGKGLLAEIYRPAAEFLGILSSPYASDVYEATRQAGRELVVSRAISPDTLARITQPLGDIDDLLSRHNTYWQKVEEDLTADKNINPNPGA